MHAVLPEVLLQVISEFTRVIGKKNVELLIQLTQSERQNDLFKGKGKGNVDLYSV